MKVFIEKVYLHSSLKGYENEKAAQNLASRLEGRAFDVYMRLSDQEKSDVSAIKAELLREFERGNQDRKVAIIELSNRTRKQDESTQTFAFKFQELVKLAYPTFDESALDTIAKDYFIKGLHPKMQVALKSWSDFTKANINQLTSETTRLQLAGIESFASNPSDSSSMNPIHSDTLVDEITNKVVEKSKGLSLSNSGGEVDS